MVRNSILVIAPSAMAMIVAPLFLASQEPKATSLAPETLPRIGTIDERFQSYNVEMVEVTGGRFWKLYASKAASPAPGQPAANQPTGIDPGLYEYRKPIDLYNPRLRKLAAALGPAYIRVSGTWANTTFFQNTDGPALTSPPKGFNGILTRSQWKGVVDFSRAVNAEIVTSFAISPGARDASGIWTSDQARQVVDFTNSIGTSRPHLPRPRFCRRRHLDDSFLDGHSKQQCSIHSFWARFRCCLLSFLWCVLQPLWFFWRRLHYHCGCRTFR